MPAPLRMLATRRRQPLSFESELLPQAGQILRGNTAPPQEFMNQLRGRMPQGPLELIFADALKQGAPMSREAFLASGRPPTWATQSIAQLGEPVSHEMARELAEDAFWSHHTEPHLKIGAKVLKRFTPQSLNEIRHALAEDPEARVEAYFRMGPHDRGVPANVMNGQMTRGQIRQAQNFLTRKADLEDLFHVIWATGPTRPGSPSDLVHPALRDVRDVAEREMSQRMPETSLFRSLYQDFLQGPDNNQYENLQRIAQLPKYFEMGLSSLSHPWTRDPKVIGRALQDVDRRSEVQSALVSQYQPHFPDYPNLIGSVRGSLDPQARAVAVEEIQPDPLQAGAKHPTFRDAYGALGKMVMQQAARRGYENVFFPTGETVAAVRGPSARKAMERIYSEQLFEQLHHPMRDKFDLRPRLVFDPEFPGLYPRAGERPEHRYKRGLEGAWWQYNLEDPEIRRALATSIPHFAKGGPVFRKAKGALEQLRNLVKSAPPPEAKKPK